MKKVILYLFALSAVNSSNGQTASDLFYSKEVKVSWLGIDFSHTKLIGSFEQIQGVLNQSPQEIKNDYFPRWNRLIINEAQKYDVNAMLRKENVRYDIEMIMGLNALTPIGNMQVDNPPDYTRADIEKFVSEYKLEGKSGIGVVFVNECLNKAWEEAIFHVVVLNLSTKEILIYERIKENRKDLEYEIIGPVPFTAQ